MNPQPMIKIINRTRYDTSKAALLAGNDHWDGHNFERGGTNTFLYRTTRGSYFALHLTQWQGRRNHIEPLTQNEAIEMYESMSEQRVEYAEAFPGVKIEEA